MAAPLLLDYLNHRICLTINDGRKYEGVLKSTDSNYNYVLSDTEEFINDQRGRYLGLVFFRGQYVLNVNIICKEKDIQKKEVDRFKNEK